MRILQKSQSEKPIYLGAPRSDLPDLGRAFGFVFSFPLSWIPLDPVTCVLLQKCLRQRLPPWNQGALGTPDCTRKPVRNLPVSLPGHLSFWSKKRGWPRQRVMVTSWGKWPHSILFTGLHHIFGSSYHLASSSDVSILISPRVTISSEGLSSLNFFINWYPSSSNLQDKLYVMNTIISIM